MISKVITDRCNNFSGGYSDEPTVLAPRYTIATVIICLASPFLFLYRIVRYVFRLGAFFTLRLRRKVRRLANA